MSELPELFRDNAMLVVVHPHNNECCAITGLGTAETEAAVSAIVRLMPMFNKAGIPVRVIFAAEAGADPQKAYGGVHRAVSDVIGLDNKTYQAHDPSVFVIPELRAEIKATARKHIFLAGFNLSDCVGKSAIMARTHEDLSKPDVTILSDATADRSDIALAELYSDSGVGESMMSLMRRALNIRMARSQTVLEKLGIPAI